MKDASRLHEGDRVNYSSYPGATPENGIVKRHSDFTDKVFIVFNCGDDWDNYKDYTAALTPINNVELGWL